MRKRKNWLSLTFPLEKKSEQSSVKEHAMFAIASGNETRRVAISFGLRRDLPANSVDVGKGENCFSGDLSVVQRFSA